MPQKSKSQKNNYTIALVGNPNVGKSVIFNQLTGLGVSTANYPGTTVKINEGKTVYKYRKIRIVDLPGTYGLGGISEDQWVTRQALLEKKPDCLIVITDATNLGRNLYIVLQLIDLGFPLVVCLNLTDLAESKKITTDTRKLSALLGVPVVPTVAIQGKGVGDLIKKAINVKKQSRRYKYGSDLEVQLKNINKKLTKSKKIPYGLSPEAFAFLLMEGDKDFTGQLKSLNNGKEVSSEIEKAKKSIFSSHRQPLNTRLALERHGLAGSIASASQTSIEVKERFIDKIWRFSTNPVIGLILLFAFITGFFSLIVFSGLYLSQLFQTVWSVAFSPAIKSAIYFAIGKNSISKILLWGFDDGILAGLSIGVAFILPFYFLLSLLEDSGYLNSIAFLSDRVAHRIGLHGRSIIPLISAAGCNVPAIMGTRALGNKRERFIASTLISMTPCSARTAVILGSVALFAGIEKAIFIYLISIVLIFITGFSLNKLMPGKSTGLVMELFPFRLPTVKNTFKKTWAHLKGFLSLALPFIVIGSLVMGIMIETGILPVVSKPVSFLSVNILGLPAITGIVLLAGFLRKEMALELLYVLAAAKLGSGFKLPDLMTPNQMFVFALVVALYIPCLASLSILNRELGWKKALSIGLLTTVIAFTVGGLFNYGFKIF